MRVAESEGGQVGAARDVHRGQLVEDRAVLRGFADRRLDGADLVLLARTEGFQAEADRCEVGPAGRAHGAVEPLDPQGAAVGDTDT